MARWLSALSCISSRSSQSADKKKPKEKRPLAKPKENKAAAVANGTKTQNGKVTNHHIGKAPLVSFDEGNFEMRNLLINVLMI